MTKDELYTFFHDSGIVPVVKIDDADKAVPLAKAMIDGGINSAEITFRTAAAEEAIRKVTAAFPKMVVGAGTVINPQLAEKAVAAGAKFIVSAGFNRDTVAWCLSHNIPVVPGVCTPSDGTQRSQVLPCRSIRRRSDAQGSFRTVLTGKIHDDRRNQSKQPP